MGLMDRMKQAAESAQAATSKLGVGASADQMALANRAKRLMSEGVDTPARIDAMDATGNTDTPGGTEYDITFTVSPADADTYQVVTNQYIYPSSPYSTGESVIVKVAPGEPDVLMIFGKA